MRHFERNATRADDIDADRADPCLLDERRRAAFVRSFQRFELAERSDGRHVLAAARRVGDERYTHALGLLVAEECRHSAMFGAGLRRLGGEPLAQHWSDRVFTMLRRACGLRTELCLFLVAESVSLDYFDALAVAAPDPVLRAVGARVAADERNHLRFQLARISHDRPAAAPLRWAARTALLAVGTGAAVVVAVDHRAALRACGRHPLRYPARAIRTLRHQLRAAFPGVPDPLGPLPLPLAPGDGDRAVG